MFIEAGENFTLSELRTAINAAIDDLAEADVKSTNQIRLNFLVFRDVCSPDISENKESPREFHNSVGNRKMRAYSFHCWSHDISK